jgi:hypothetical protein
MQLYRIGAVPILPPLFSLCCLDYAIIYSSLYFITTGYEPKPNLQTKQKPYFFKSPNMTRSKPNKPKSPHKEQIEEQNNKDKTETTPRITPQTSKPSKTTTGVEVRSTKSSTPREKYIQNPEHIPYYDGDTLDRRIYRRERNKHQLDEDGEPINSTNNEFMQPSDEDAQGNVLPDKEIERKRMSAAQQTPSKEDSKPSAQSEA